MHLLLNGVAVIDMKTTSRRGYVTHVKLLSDFHGRTSNFILI